MIIKIIGRKNRINVERKIEKRTTLANHVVDIDVQKT